MRDATFSLERRGTHGAIRENFPLERCGTRGAICDLQGHRSMSMSLVTATSFFTVALGVTYRSTGTASLQGKMSHPASLQGKILAYCSMDPASLQGKYRISYSGIGLSRLCQIFLLKMLFYNKLLFGKSYEVSL